MGITHFRRFHGYDYSRGVSIFITFHLEPRMHVFGEVTRNGVMELSAAGKLVEVVVERERLREDAVAVMRYQIMPEHLHFRLWVKPGQTNPLWLIGRFVSNIKRWSAWEIKKQLNVDIRRQENYHDKICMNKRIMDHVDSYIVQNPRKWALMYGDNPPMAVIEPLQSCLLPPCEWWSGVGNATLLDGAHRISAFRLSRSLPECRWTQIIGVILEECLRGLVPISTFLSPAERALYNALVANGYPMIRVVPDALKAVYRPKVEELPAFCRELLLLLSCLDAREDSREKAWNNVNEVIANVAVNTGGRAVYLK